MGYIPLRGNDGTLMHDFSFIQGAMTGNSEQRIPAVDHERIPSVIPRRLAHQVHRDAAEIVATPQRRIGIRGITLPWNVRSWSPLRHVGLDPPRQDRMRAHIVRANSTASERTIEIIPPLVAA